MLNNKVEIWSELSAKKLLLIAMSLVLVTHGVIIYYTLPKTYDAFVHMFFADHYARFWFEPWEYRWYTGFLTISYPPLVHQSIALLSEAFPLKVAFSIYSIFIYEVFVIGIYRFTKIFYCKNTAGVAAIVAVVLSSIIETLHVFGQVPTLAGLGFMLNAIPFLYQYLTKRKTIYLLMTLAFLSIVISSHHVTVIFGMVFFIAPTIYTALADNLRIEESKSGYFGFVLKVIKSAFKESKPIIIIVGLTIVLAIALIFPYWYWSKTDPITQVSIPHGSRDNFFENFSSGLIFYIIPLALIFATLPAITYKLIKQKRFFAWGVSFYVCLLLGSGGSTPLPKLMLGETAFNILTLDRFGFWASIIAIPFMAKFIYSFIAGPVREFWIKNFGTGTHFVLSGLSAFSYFLFVIFIFHLASFRPLQPDEIDIKPIQNFLNRDEHMRWRYLTLGFGDQMAWLSANTLAATVDGNYHSARRLPELTSRPVERLENAKYRGISGIASLKDFLTNSEKYHLKYVFNNDRYYDPLLYYTGWNRTIRLENGIMVWEKGNITTIKPIEPKSIDPLLKYMWGIFPFASLIVGFLFTIFYLTKYKEGEYLHSEMKSEVGYPISIIYSTSLLPILVFTTFMFMQVYELLLVKKQKDPESTVMNYYAELDFQRFESAFKFFKPTPEYTLDQFLLEKSVKDGGLLPSFAKLDSIFVNEINRKEDTCNVEVFTRWNTALGFYEKIDTLKLQNENGVWYIFNPAFNIEIPEEQMRTYTFTLFKKQGKRVISSFPTVKDDKIKKSFAEFEQINFIKHGTACYVTGEITNKDNIPINIALMIKAKFENGSFKSYYPASSFIYNLAPKGKTFFQVDLDSIVLLDSLKLTSLEIYAETDVTERGYIHGGTPGYSVSNKNNNNVSIRTSFYNELSTDIAIPGLLIAEKDSSGTIWQVRLNINPTSLRSGIKKQYKIEFQKIRGSAEKIDSIPITSFINGRERELNKPQKDELALKNNEISILPHCFISEVIYLH